MYIVIVGANELGKFLAKTLIEENHDVVVIDKNKDVCEQVANELDLVCSNGDATEQKVLENAGIKESDAVVSLTTHDETNMVVSLLAKELGAKTVAARLGKTDYNEKVLERLGIDIVVHPEAAEAGYIAEMITKPELLDLAFISKGSAEIMEVKIGEKSKIVGKKVSELGLPEGCSLIAILENDDILIPKPDSIIKKGQKVLIIAKRDVVEAVRKAIN